MLLSAFSRGMAKSLADRSPVILTGMAVAGLATTVYLALKAKPVADQKIFDAQYNQDEDSVTDISLADKAFLVWKDYAPAAVMGVVTASCIIGIHSVHSRRAATLMSLYTLSEGALKEYKAKVVETLGSDKEEKISADIAKDRIEQTPPPSEIVMIGDNKQLCYDMYSGRYFRSDIETIRKAMNDTNQEAIQNFHVPLNMFYAAVGLEETRVGDEVGFNSEHLMDIRFTSHLTSEKVPCLALDFYVDPSKDYDRFH